MWIDNLFAAWRPNIALHATLEIKSLKRIDNDSRDLITFHTPSESGEPLARSQIKFQGKTKDGIDAYVNIELIGNPDMLALFKFKPGSHVGLVIRAID